MNIDPKDRKSIEIRHLRYFTTVAEAKSFSKAAEQLGITQPPLSSQLQELEHKLLGVKLFVDRQKRPIELTPAGQAFFEGAKAILKTLDRATEKTKLIDEYGTNYLTVGFTPAIANSIMPDILQFFRQTYPKIRLILSEESSVIQIQRLHDRTIDIMFLYEYSGMFKSVTEAEDFEIKQVRRELLVVALPENHRLAANLEISITDLHDLDFIMPDRQFASGLFTEIKDLFQRSNSTCKIVLEAVFMNSILGLVAGGIGISILPDSIQNVQRKGVVYRPIYGHNTTTNQLCLVWRKENVSTILENFIKVADDFTVIVQNDLSG